MNDRGGLEWYHFTVLVQIREADVDHQGHVNNVAMTGLHVEARNLWHNELLQMSTPQAVTRELGSIHTRCYTCRYLTSTFYLVPLIVGVRLVDVAVDEYRLATGAFQDGRCTSEMDCTLGCGTGDRWAALPEHLWARLVQYRSSHAT